MSAKRTKFKSPFKEGDVVRLKDDVTTYTHTGVGTVVSDVTLDAPDFSIGVRWDYYDGYNDQYRQDFHWCRVEVLELAAPSEAEVEAAIASIKGA